MTDILGPTNAANSVTSRPADTRAGAFGGTDTWIKDCSSQAAQDGTALMAGWFNSIIANLRALVRGNGNLLSSAPVVAEDNADTMILRAVQQLIQRGQANYAVDVGVADALVINPTPALEEYKAGVPFLVLKTGAANATTTPTINASSLGLKTIVARDGAALSPGDLPANGLLWFACDGTNVRLLGSGGSLSLTQINSVPSVPRGGAEFTTAGVHSFTVPAGITRVFAEVVGAGGSGGSSAGVWFGGSGGGGGYANLAIAVTPGQVITVTVGAGGAAVAPGGGNGNNGGSTSFGPYVSATGGGGGANSPTAGAAVVGGSGGVGSGGASNLIGAAGNASNSSGTANNYPAGGAPGCLGGQGGTNCAPGSCYGSGGSGGGGSPSLTSGAGAPGYARVTY